MADEDFEMIPVTSSQIESIGYNDGKLRIQFLKGGLYEYSGCNEEEYDRLIAAPSVGAEFQNSIKGKKQYQKL